MAAPTNTGVSRGELVPGGNGRSYPNTLRNRPDGPFFGLRRSIRPMAQTHGFPGCSDSFGSWGRGGLIEIASKNDEGCSVENMGTAATVFSYFHLSVPRLGRD